MRQQLIEYLIEDIAPRIQKSGKAEEELVKFANEKNLSPALLEALGQLFNTAKTLSFLEKSANRGASFPTVDVEKMVNNYLEVPAKKLAHDPDGWSSTDSEFGNLAAMPDLFAMPDTDCIGIEMPKIASHNDFDGPMLHKMNLETAQRVKFDTVEDARGVLDELVKIARRSPLDFAELEADSVALLGDIAKPACEKAAAYLTEHNIAVKRATLNDESRFINNPLVEKIEKLAAAINILPEIDAIISELEAPLKKEAAANIIDLFPTGPSVGSPMKKREEDLLSRGKGESSPFKTVPDAAFGLLAPIRDQYFRQAQKVLTPDQNVGKEIDRTMDETKQTAMLQDLLTTDEILSEADPDEVVAAYETIRNTAPELAKDKNVMRVTLRSAIQHQGIDPFTVKGIAETETARQKVQQAQNPKSNPKPEKDPQ